MEGFLFVSLVTYGTLPGFYSMGMAYRVGDMVRIAWLRLTVQAEYQGGFILRTDSGAWYILDQNLRLSRMEEEKSKDFDRQKINTILLETQIGISYERR